MDKSIRQQLTLFVDKKDASEIESVRKKFNPRQQQLIDSHVTLCREDEITSINKVLDTLQNIDTSAIIIQFGQATRFDNNKGVLLPASGDNEQFHQLRKKIFTALNIPERRHEPHITLMHPRNSNCSDESFEEIKSVSFPTSLKFDTVSLIEQIDGGQWRIIKRFNLMSH
ncbi:MAG: 2'-5' RNA ligase family protein [Gammaproteobacteria bacterium]|nr:MAG: 2'-5' RNA ligase family protein [Gammaproteobacteria bacterium]